MKRQLVWILLLSAALLTAGASGTLAAGKPKGVPYVFSGTLLTDPPSGSTSISVHVRTGNKRALRQMIGQSADQAFSVGPNTVYLRWSEGIPSQVSQDALKAGDWVTVRVRAPRHSTLAQVEANAAAVVAARDHKPGTPALPLFLFRGKLVGSAAGGHLTLDVKGGNKRALRKLIGQSAQQTFTYDNATVFIRWQGRIPSVISPDQLKAGDRLTVRIRSPKGSSLAQLESTPAKRVALHEKAAKS